jgi:hypothetical protein
MQKLNGRRLWNGHGKKSGGNKGSQIMKCTFLIVALALAACAQLESSQEISPGIHRLYYIDREPFGGNGNVTQFYMDKYSKEKCPNGFKKLSEETNRVDDRYAYTWTIRCFIK